MRAVARSQRGQFVVAGVVFLAFLLLVVQSMAWWTMRETRWTDKEHKTTKAFYLADTGIDRAIYQIRSTSLVFDQILAGNIPAGFRNDKIFTDVAGGQYKVQISSGPGLEQITVRATAKDTSAKEYRSIEAVIQRDGGMVSPMMAPALSFGGSAAMHWGPIMSAGTLNLGGSANELYPRKLAKGAILGSGTYGNRDTAGSSPNTDSLEWYSFNESPGVPELPSLDLEYYKAQSQAQGNYSAASTVNISDFVDTSTSAVRYYEGNVKFNATTHFRGVLIVMGNLDFAGGGASPEGLMSVTPPANAWMEYQKNTPSTGTGCGGGGGSGAANDGNYANNSGAEGDKACLHQYPGDGGYHVVEDYVIGSGCAAHGHLGGASGDPVSFAGLIYVRGEMKATARAVIYGTIIAAGGMVGTGNIELFLNNDQTAVTRSLPTLEQVSWEEVQPEQF